MGRLKRAVLLDALGTLLDLEPPAPRLVAELRARRAEVSEREAGAAIAAEIAYYRAHLDEARDAAGLADLRARCTEVLRGALPPAARDVPDLGAALLASLRFRPYPEVPDALRRLRAAGLRLVVVSNWDVSLHEVLAATGLDAHVDGAVSSAETGASKPDPAIFRAGLDVARAAPGEALHAGDSLDADVLGARAAGIDAVLVARDGSAPAGVRAVASLAELPELASSLRSE